MAEINQDPKLQSQHPGQDSESVALAQYRDSTVQIIARQPMVPGSGFMNMIIRSDAIGTGFFVSPDKKDPCQIISDNHVIAGPNTPYVIVHQSGDQGDRTAKVAGEKLENSIADLQTDVATLHLTGDKTSTDTCKSLPLASAKEAANYLGNVDIISYHTGNAELKHGEILGTAKMTITSSSSPDKKVEREVLVLNVPGGGPGDSGAPVIGTKGSAKGKVLGVVEAGGGNLAIAIPVSQVQKVLDQIH